jgi:hypothetical protein
VLRSEDLFADPQATFARVLAFLGLQPAQLAEVAPFNRIAGTLAPATRARLAAELAPDTAALEDRLGRSFGWSTSASASAAVTSP